MALEFNKPYVWLKKITSGQYSLHLRVRMQNRDLPVDPVPNLAGGRCILTYTTTATITAGGQFDRGPIAINVDPSIYDDVMIEIKDNSGATLGKSTAHTTEADASGGDDDDMLRPFFENLGIIP